MLLAAFPVSITSKEAQYGPAHPPPRGPVSTTQPATIVPLEQLWTRIPRPRRQELLEQLSRILAQQLAPPSSEEEADE